MKPPSRTSATSWRRPLERTDRDRALGLAGGVVSVVVALVLFTRFGIHGALSRDEAIYTYGGQQLAHGVAPYASIFDPKTPLATMIAGVAAAVARVTGRDDVAVIRAAFLACSVLTVLATYLLGTRLWRSRLAGLASALVFVSYRGFAGDALGGPDAKTPGVLFVVVSMLLLTRRQWFWSAVAGSLGFLVWQPLVCYPALVFVLALIGTTRQERPRALAQAVTGAVLPVLLVSAYLLAAGTFGRFVEAAVVFPVVGIEREPVSLLGRLGHIAEVVQRYYGVGAGLLWLGMVLLAARVIVHLVRHRAHLSRAALSPLVCVVGSTMLAQTLYASTDFQGYPDAYPLLVYGALGIGGAVAFVAHRLVEPRARRLAAGGLLLALSALTVSSGVSFAHDRWNDEGLRAQQVNGCAIDRILPRGRVLWALGNATPLVTAHRRNPDRYVFLQSGVDTWKMDHTPGGFDGWTAQIAAVDPAVVVMDGWSAPTSFEMQAWLRTHGYVRVFVGRWRTYVDRAAYARARKRGVALSRLHPQPVVTGPGGADLSASCERAARKRPRSGATVAAYTTAQ